MSDFRGILRGVFQKSGHDVAAAAKIAKVTEPTFRRWAKSCHVSLALPDGAPKKNGRPPVRRDDIRTMLVEKFGDYGSTNGEILTRLLSEAHGRITPVMKRIGVPTGSTTSFRDFMIKEGVPLEEFADLTPGIPAEQRRWEERFLAEHRDFGDSVPAILREVLQLTNGNATEATRLVDTPALRISRGRFFEYCKKYGVEITKAR